ncbi:YqjF family protein [Pseudonocardia endophytica]|uniref:DUF2071 domain-containing protein n=1 Tax=Pseudonocardia endophytica TaxID=401976 RepID=A0A4R1HRG1_PSEEN|nr:DUF2071 domain-containing protein [Pseudonocardia endophytica]TCK25194.1 hypothetical protein EV378_0994 [Pseudonocardia endophytica]
MNHPEPVRAVAPGVPPPLLSRQSWRDVTFLHWAVEPSRVAPLLPAGVRPDVHDGRTWVGLVPFRMVGAGFGRGPAVPWAGTFCETNVRLYSVDRDGTRGVVFLGLDAERLAVVLGARAVFGLPYRWARMRIDTDGGDRTYTASSRWPGTRFRGRIRIRPRDGVLDGPLDRFLTARWGLHVAHLGRTWYVPNEHEPWPLRAATVLELDGGPLASVGFGDLTDRPPEHVAFADGVDVRFGMPRRV